MSNILPSKTSYKTALEILMFYINNANIESAHALLKDQEISIDMTNDLGMTPLHQAVKVSNLSMVNLLLDYGANPNVKTEWRLGNETPLMIACINNYYEIGKLLLDYGADPTGSNSQGFPCLHLACMNGSVELALLMIARGCDPTMRDGFGNNASYWAKRNGFDDYIKFTNIKPETVSPMDNQYYRDCVEEKYLLITAEEKKKMMKGKGKGKKKK